MCLGIPGQVTETYREHDVLMGKVEFGGVAKRVCLEHVQDTKVGDYVLVHVGFALQRIDEAEARRVFEFLAEMQQLDELQAGSEVVGSWGGEKPDTTSPPHHPTTSQKP
jgi:hydrogenase expression/formation protein HypC